MKYLSLFTGIGGFELGIKQAYESNRKLRKENGFYSDDDMSNNIGNLLQGDTTQSGGTSCIGYSEIDKYAIQVYEQHFNHKNYGDITKINADELPDFDLLVGGFPCQAFSIAGKRKGFEDTRGTLFFDIARILKAKRPRYFVLENVKGLLSHDSGQTFRTIIATLTELGYDLEWQVLNSKNFGVPQNRERVFIIGHLRGTSCQQVFPVRETITELSNKQVQESSGSGPLPIWKVSDTEGTRREILSGVKIRRLTPKECERLQGFPDDWTACVSDTQRYKCCGNAVTVNVIEYIFSKLI